MIIENVKGFKDFLGEDALKRERLKQIMIKQFRNYGFLPAETPIIEYEEFVKGENASDEAVSDIFRLKDKGQRNLALRYELTFQLKRIAKNKKLPYKRYQIGEVFRDEPVSSNRYREFTQCDIDVIGSSFRDEAEVLKLFSKILDEVNLGAIIYINNRNLLNEILEKENIKEKDQVLRELDKLDKLPEADVKINLAKFNAEKLITIFKKPENFFKKYDNYKEIEELKNYCDYFGVKVVFSPTLVRGLSYYNGSVFEIRLKDIKGSIAGGGSYLIDGIQSTGISFGLERFSSLVNIDINNTKCLIISINQNKETINLAEKLRDSGISVVLSDKISKGLDYANAYGIHYVIFVGSDEVKNKKFKLKDMKSGKEEFLSEKELIMRSI